MFLLHQGLSTQRRKKFQGPGTALWHNLRDGSTQLLYMKKNSLRKKQIKQSLDPREPNQAAKPSLQPSTSHFFFRLSTHTHWLSHRSFAPRPPRKVPVALAWKLHAIAVSGDRGINGMCNLCSSLSAASECCYLYISIHKPFLELTPRRTIPQNHAQHCTTIFTPLQQVLMATCYYLTSIQ